MWRGDQLRGGPLGAVRGPPMPLGGFPEALTHGVICSGGTLGFLLSVVTLQRQGLQVFPAASHTRL